jgi:lipopolysaccharide export system protein LptA
VDETLTCAIARFGWEDATLSWTCRAVLFGLGTCALLCARPAMATAPRALVLRGPRLGALRLSADQLAYQPAASRIELRGQVSLDAGQVKLRATQLTVRLDRQGRPTWVEARGKVTVVLGESHGSADRADVALAERKLAMIGNVRLQLGGLGLALQGERVDVDLATGRLAVQSARAQLRSPATAPVAGGAR